METLHTTEKQTLNTEGYNDLLTAILEELATLKKFKINSDLPRSEKRRILHALITTRNPKTDIYSEELHAKIDRILYADSTKKGILEAASIPRAFALFQTTSDAKEFLSKIAIWKGDITTLAIDAIVNAANVQMLGCFQPGHRCIDNVIHGAAGPRLRDACYELLRSLHRRLEPEGSAKITPAFSLPSKHVIHTVGPNLNDNEERADQNPTQDEINTLRSCYRSCLDLVHESGLKSIAFCCISTGIFGFPGALASHIAVDETKRWLEAHSITSIDLVLFNTFLPRDEDHYVHELEQLTSSKADLSLLRSLEPIPTGRDAPGLAIEWLKNADAILISAGAGLSASAGLDYTSEEVFKKTHPAMHKRGFRNMYQFIGYHDWDEDLQWGYLLQHINKSRYNWPQSQVYQDLKKLVERNGNYFVYTSNADGMFEQNGFPQDRVLTTQGDYSRLQCLKPCAPDSVWPVQSFLDAAIPKIDPDTQLLTDPDAIPRCPRCSGNMMMNVRGGDWFLEEHFAERRASYREWLRNSLGEAQKKGKLVVILEIGAGFNTPSVVRWPMESLVQNNNAARLIRINAQHPEFSDDIESKAVGISQDATEIIRHLLKSVNETI